ncbi:MAG: PAS domain-containing protein, partial [Halothece sp. Uz-M2-17]|nr:PAS domain-containing protein [Halothece sp. Uz-M2-17]
AQGIYTERIQNEVSAERLNKYFSYRNNKYHVSPLLRKMITFAPHNLVKNVGFTRMNFVSCRNTLIYMQPSIQDHILRMLHFALIPKGLLLLGIVDTVGELGEELETVSDRYRVFQKKRNIKLPLIKDSLSEYIPPQLKKKTTTAQNLVHVDPLISFAFSQFARDRACTCLLANTNFKLFHVVSDACDVLQVAEGKITNNVSDLLPNELRLPTTMAMNRSRKEDKTVAYNSITFTQKDTIRTVNIEATYYANHRQIDNFFLLTITNDSPRSLPTDSETFQQSTDISQHILDLEYELQETKENLHNTIKELETANEEQQAGNEELLAYNEELQSTNEELHSVNEELQTLNREYQGKIRELTELNNDIDNLLRATEIGVIFLDQDLNIRRFTPASTQAINLETTDIGRPLRHITHNLDCDHLLELLQSVITHEDILEEEVKVKPTNQDLLMRVYPYREKDGTYQGLVITFIDITYMKTIQRALEQRTIQLRDQTQELEELYDNAPVGLAVHDDQGRYVRINKILARINGYSVQAHFGKTVTEILGKMGERIEPIIQQVLQTQEPVRNIEVESQKPSNFTQKGCWLVSYYPFNYTDGRRFVFAVVTDITEQKQVQEKLASQLEKESLLKQITEQIHSIFDPELFFQEAVKIIGKTFGVNRCLLHLYDEDKIINSWPIQAEYIEGKHCVSMQELGIKISADNPYLYTLLEEEKALASEDTTTNPLLVTQAQFLEKFGIRSMMTVATYYQGKPNGIIYLHHCPTPDTSEEQKLRYWDSDEIELLEAVARQMGIAIAQIEFLKELQATQKQLEEKNQILEQATLTADAANRAKTDFLANMSHELRSPLNAILGGAEILEDPYFGSLSEAQQKHVQAIESSGRHLLDLISDILDLSKVEAGKIEVKKKTVKLSKICQDSLEFIRQIAREKNIQLQTQLITEDIEINVDERRIRQILINLLTNAVKFTPPTGCITLTTEIKPTGTPWKGQQEPTVTLTQPTLVISVIDTGIGITAQDQVKIFEPFTQADTALNRKYEGTGLGLPLSQKIANLHKGWITVQSEVEQGSCFSLLLPEALNSTDASTPDSTAKETMSETTVTPSTGQILLAEDNPPNQMTIFSYLEARGYTLILAN